MNNSPVREFFQSCWKNVNFMIGFIIILSVIIIAIFAEQIAPFPFDEAHKDAILQAPNRTYWFGTDDFGRDMFSRIISGTRITLQVAFVGALIQLTLGITVDL